MRGLGFIDQRSMMRRPIAKATRPLLGTVVEVALEPPALGIPEDYDPRPRGRELALRASALASAIATSSVNPLIRCSSPG